jgi:hypothetical protein
VHPGARLLVFRRLAPDELEIFRTELAAAPPSIAKLVVDGSPDGDYRLTWSSEHDRPVTFSVFFWPDGRPALLLASGLREDSFKGVSGNLPGPTGRFAVAASDGYRSSVAVSRAIEGLSTAVHIRITAPADGSLVPPDQAVNLVARAEDVSGTTVAIDQLAWAVDGRAAGQGQVIAIPAPDPGEHEIEATGLRGAEPVGRDVVRVTVADRSEDQAAFAKRVADLPPLETRRRETGA